MGYLIEIYLDKRHKQGNIEEKIIENALLNQCERYYGNHHISGIRKTIHIHRYIITFLFPDNIKHITQFINFINTNKLNINTIAYDNCIFRQLYPKKSKKLTKEDLNILKLLKKYR